MVTPGACHAGPHRLTGTLLGNIKSAFVQHLLSVRTSKLDKVLHCLDFKKLAILLNTDVEQVKNETTIIQ